MDESATSATVNAERVGCRVFCSLVLLQGFHEVEHVVQVIQRFVLGIAHGSGVLGSIFDIEPVHLAYNFLVLGLLAATFLLLGFHRDGAKRYGAAAFGLLTLALLWQGWHGIEHIAKILQYLQLGLQNGTGGIFGAGPGGLVPLFNIPWLHFWYNTVLFGTVFAAFLLCGMPKRAAQDLRLTLKLQRA